MLTLNDLASMISWVSIIYSMTLVTHFLLNVLRVKLQKWSTSITTVTYTFIDNILWGYICCCNYLSGCILAQLQLLKLANSELNDCSL